MQILNSSIELNSFLPDLRVLVCGGRDFNNKGLLFATLDTYLGLYLAHNNIILVSGHAKGADSLVEEYAIARGYRCEIYPAEWDNLNVPHCRIKHRYDGTLYNALAGFNRNKEMLKVSDKVVAFWDGVSRGTKNTIDTAKSMLIETKIIPYR